ncbi:Septum site-determining protein MinD [Aquisphaera giovannonii]|uniref:Septum site-determining protein MinD n=1 Tax=Aquisphaera giovannonii TaxID=406548 RepID=A0A5B9W243_9BACT|nr:MinD/ParA family protein [Aquisphaera giovannonii]QEH34304.1 Septum site-determining protein MinD [Aquisphaera giovannonii]
MRDVIRVVLVDPNEESRRALQRLLGSLAVLWLAEAFDSYKAAASRVAEIAPDLCLVALDADPAQAVELIAGLSHASPGTVLLPASATCDSGLILKAIRAGAREFLTLPTEAAEVSDIVSRLFRGRGEAGGPGAKGPQLVTITGASGGVGCTSTAVNLATTLASGGHGETILLDFDLMFGSVDACLDIIPDNTLSNVIQNLDRLDLTLLKRSMTRHASGLYVLPHPVALEDSARIDPEALRRLLGLLKAAFPNLVIDTSKGLQSSDFVAFEMADVILVVISLDLTCLRNTARLLNLFHQFEGMADRVKLVVNRAGSAESEIGLKKAEETLKMPISFQVPIASKAFQAARVRGVPLADVAAGSRAHQAILEIARSLRGDEAAGAEKPRKGLFAAFF